MIKAVIFDMDGLMFDTERLSLEGWIYAGHLQGVNLRPEDITSAIGLDYANTRHMLSAKFGPGFDYDAAHAAHFKYMDEQIAERGVPEKPGLRELLAVLTERGIPRALASSSQKERVMGYLEKTGLKDSFNAIISGDMVEHGKPAPDIFLKAAQGLASPPKNCLVLEDSPHGILAAHRAGAMPVMVPDLLQPDEFTLSLLYAKCASLFEVEALL